MKKQDEQRSGSIVIPVFNNAGTILELYKRLTVVLSRLFDQYEIIFIDDFSQDNSAGIIKNLIGNDSSLRLIKFRKNYGQTAAIEAGIRYSSNNYVVIMDADLQDRPEQIPLLMEALDENLVKMAVAKWRSRQDHCLRKTASNLFYYLSQFLTTLTYEPNLGVFRIITREALEGLEKSGRKQGTLLSRLHWIKTPYCSVEMDRDPRKHGFSGYTLKKLVNLAMYRLYSYPRYSLKSCLYVALFFLFASLIFRENRTLKSGVFCSISTFVAGSMIKRYYRENDLKSLFVIEESCDFTKGNSE